MILCGFMYVREETIANNWMVMVFFSVLNSSSIFGYFWQPKLAPHSIFFLLKVEWGAIFGSFRFRHDRSMEKREKTLIVLFIVT